MHPYTRSIEISTRILKHSVNNKFDFLLSNRLEIVETISGEYFKCPEAPKQMGRKLPQQIGCLRGLPNV
ncbi:hypothetical protein K7X08_018609 [Anisodus acutangulus]|uniref:Uncharacterized protein n=1 Tax=Anisodus acutangulus TaxID=402998 RepID=A0A9Q1LY08_9SOLA|nr:hypothetical protein K7X08_018609 [Anisodus acutangulus]